MSLYKFVDDDLENEGKKRERTIYDVLRTARYPSVSHGKYINGPIVKKKLWTLLGDYLSKGEKMNRNDLDPTLFSTFRMDGHSFSKKILPFLKSKGIISKGYSLDFENAMKLAQVYVFDSIPNVICSFCQSDEITVLMGPSKIDKNGNICPIAHRGRFQKYNSLPSSGVASTFVLALATALVERGETSKVPFIPSVEFDCRIGQYTSFEAAMQMILWRAYDCSVNGISSGIHLNEIPNKKSTDRFNSSQKLEFLESNGLLETMTDHQLYGTFLWKEYVEETIVTKKGSYVRHQMKMRNRSDQILKVIKEFMVASLSECDDFDGCEPDIENQKSIPQKEYLHHDYCLSPEFNEIVV